jgi:cobalt/nickel transport system ATP-binding protein
MSNPILAAHNICFDYPGDIPALKSLNLSIKKGQRLAILGPNGAGKTTLLLHLNGTLQPKTGSITLNGKPGGYSRSALREWRSKVGLVLQEADDQLFSASVRQDISFGPMNLGLPEDEVRSRVDEAIAALNIGHVINRPTHMLSFGQKKRVAIAGIMAMHPDVLILDEPTAGLDPSGEERLLLALDTLYKRGTSLVFSTHNIDFAWAWSDEVALFKDGQVLHQGPTAEVLLDKHRLDEIGLKPPLIAELGQEFVQRGLSTNIPRTRNELLSLVQRATKHPDVA